MDVDARDGEKLVEANRKAIEFLQSIDFQCLSKAIFKDHLAVLSQDGKTIIGELNISVEETIRDEEVCYLVQTHNYCVLDGVPMGASITAYISRGMKTLYLLQHDYSEVGGKTIEKKTVLVNDGSQYIIKKTITKGENVSEIERVYPAASMFGYISDGATIVLERIMCIKEDVPESAYFLSLDTSLNLVNMTYEKLLDELFEVDGSRVRTIGVEREAKSFFRPVLEQTRFLMDGHMATKTIPGNLYQMKLVKMPKDDTVDEEESKSEQEDLRWQEDMMLRSYFIDRKEELKNDHQTYLHHKPELQAMLKDFLQFTLLRKPDDICAFAADYFGLLSTKNTAPSLPEGTDSDNQVN